MRICVYGAGAIGGHLAVRLARGGAEVSVLARGAHLAAISKRPDGAHRPTASSMHACRPAMTRERLARRTRCW